MSYFRINDFSKISGVSKDTLRYYDKAGVLCPSCRMENGYRFYTEYDLMRLMQIRTMRGMDAPLEECAQMMALPSMADKLTEKVDELNQQINRLTKLRDRIQMLQAEIADCIQMCGQCQIVETIPTYNVDVSDMCDWKRKLIEVWMQHTPYVHMSFLMEQLTENLKPTLLIGILKSYADTHQIDINKATERPARQAIRCVLKLKDPLQPTKQELTPILDCMREQNLQPAGAWTYRLRFIDQEHEGSECSYYVGACVAVKPINENKIEQKSDR